MAAPAPRASVSVPRLGHTFAVHYTDDPSATGRRHPLHELHVRPDGRVQPVAPPPAPPGTAGAAIDECRLVYRDAAAALHSSPVGSQVTSPTSASPSSNGGLDKEGKAVKDDVLTRVLHDYYCATCFGDWTPDQVGNHVDARCPRCLQCPICATPLRAAQNLKQKTFYLECWTCWWVSEARETTTKDLRLFWADRGRTLQLADHVRRSLAASAATDKGDDVASKALAQVVRAKAHGGAGSDDAYAASGLPHPSLLVEARRLLEHDARNPPPTRFEPAGTAAKASHAAAGVAHKVFAKSTGYAAASGEGQAALGRRLGHPTMKSVLQQPYVPPHAVIPFTSMQMGEGVPQDLVAPSVHLAAMTCNGATLQCETGVGYWGEVPTSVPMPTEAAPDVVVLRTGDTADGATGGAALSLTPPTHATPFLVLQRPPLVPRYRIHGGPRGDPLPMNPPPPAHELTSPKELEAAHRAWCYVPASLAGSIKKQDKDGSKYGRMVLGGTADSIETTTNAARFLPAVAVIPSTEGAAGGGGEVRFAWPCATEAASDDVVAQLGGAVRSFEAAVSLQANQSDESVVVKSIRLVRQTRCRVRASLPKGGVLVASSDSASVGLRFAGYRSASVSALPAAASLAELRTPSSPRNAVCGAPTAPRGGLPPVILQHGHRLTFRVVIDVAAADSVGAGAPAMWAWRLEVDVAGRPVTYCSCVSFVPPPAAK